MQKNLIDYLLYFQTSSKQINLTLIRLNIDVTSFDTPHAQLLLDLMPAKYPTFRNISHFHIRPDILLYLILTNRLSFMWLLPIQAHILSYISLKMILQYKNIVSWSCLCIIILAYEMVRSHNGLAHKNFYFLKSIWYQRQIQQNYIWIVCLRKPFQSFRACILVFIDVELERVAICQKKKEINF